MVTNEENSREAESMETLAVSVLDPYKVRGLNTTDTSGSDNPTGVLGRATGSGVTYGVQGYVDGDAKAKSSGVYGHAPFPDTYGVKATHPGATDAGTALYAEAGSSSNGTTFGVEAKTTDSSSNSAALSGDAPNGGKAVVGTASGETAIEGRSAGAVGVNGKQGTSNGTAAGVRGTTLSSDDDSKGVHGTISAGAHRAYGVLGETGTDGTGSAGVKGKATASSGKTYGILGESASEGTDAAGVRGEATATSGGAHGVYGTTSAPNGYGVYAAGDAKVGNNLEVTGDVSTTNLSASNNVSATGDVSAGNNLDVTGSQSIGEVGSTVYLGTSVGIANSSQSRVEFDQVQQDDRGEFDTNDHVHRCLTSGDYHVTVSVQWGSEAFSSYSDEFDLVIFVNSQERAEQLGIRGRSGNISKTLRDLNEDDKIYAVVEQRTGGSATLKGDQWGTFMTVDKIG